VPWPKEFPELRRAEREWLSPLRRGARLIPGYHATRAYAAAILVGSRSALEDMSAPYRGKCVLLSENAIDPARFPRTEPPPASRPLRVAFVGRLVPLKGVDMLLEAAAPLARAGQLSLEVIGDGPELPRLKSLAGELDIVAHVEFPGWVDHAQMAARLRRAQVLGFPSVREFGGGVVLEAMALGLVPIVVDYGGPGELVPAGTGFALPLRPRADLVRDLRDTLTELVAHPDQLQALGRRAQEHVHTQFTWPAKARQILSVYRRVIASPDGSTPARPSPATNP
jgi:glycosyltransferase involved in cell wall biosynthesis